jgi:hypothetical protein
VGVRSRMCLQITSADTRHPLRPGARLGLGMTAPRGSAGRRRLRTLNFGAGNARVLHFRGKSARVLELLTDR